MQSIALRQDGGGADVIIGGSQMVLIAGPCVIESEEHTFQMARALKSITSRLGLPFVFKASFDKANRTSIHSFRGPGLSEGLHILNEVRRQLDICVTTDVHSPEQADEVAAVVDLVQIPAFLCRQTDLLVAAARTGRPVNVKKGQFQAPWDMASVVEKIHQSGDGGVMLTERGSSFGYNNLVVDFRGLMAMRRMGIPVCFDATHSTQHPGGHGDSSGGQSDMAPGLARAAVATGIDAIFMEVHDQPSRAKSDASTQMKLDDVDSLLSTLLQIDQINRRPVDV